MPLDFLNRWKELSDLVDSLDTEQEQLTILGETFPFDGPINSTDGTFRPKSDADYEVEIKGGIQRRTRKHETLVKQAATVFASLGATVSSPHPIDLFITSPLKVIVEAKIALPSPRFAIRLALGQLHEYRYFLKYSGAKLCVLLDNQPDDALVAYVENELQLMLAWMVDRTLSFGPLTKTLFNGSGMAV